MTQFRLRFDAVKLHSALVQFDYEPNDEKIRLHAIPLPIATADISRRDHHFADPMPEKVLVEAPAQFEHDILMEFAMPWRHEQLPVDDLVTLPVFWQRIEHVNGR